MNQAEGAIAAARAAGAEQYAAAEFGAAIQALRQSEEAVAQSDYRLALNHAIESRTRAQAAARLAVEARARARGDAERGIAEAAALIARARERLRAMEAGGTPSRALQPARTQITHADKSLQEARAALQADDYTRVVSLTGAIGKKVEQTVAALDDIPAPARPRRRR